MPGQRARALATAPTGPLWGRSGAISIRLIRYFDPVDGMTEALTNGVSSSWEKCSHAAHKL